ncbi:hypothetical protein D3C86_1614890 [compost metagenome]
MQAGGAGLQRPQHDAVAGQDQTAEKMAIAVQRIDGHGRADHDHHQRARPALAQHLMACAYHRHPSVGAQARRMVVAIGDPGFRHRRHDPLGHDIPMRHLLDLLLHAAHHGVARHYAAEHAIGRGQARPAGFGQLIDVLEKFGAMRQQGGARMRRVVQRPFEAGVAYVDGQECHAADYPEFCPGRGFRAKSCCILLRQQPRWTGSYPTHRPENGR